MSLMLLNRITCSTLQRVKNNEINNVVLDRVTHENQSLCRSTPPQYNS